MVVNIQFYFLSLDLIPRWLTCDIGQARQTRPNSGGVAEGHPRFDKGGVAVIFYFVHVKNRTF